MIINFTACTTGYIECPGNKTCGKLCDGVPDCSDKIDEVNCSKYCLRI